MVDNVFCVANRITGDKIVNINKFFINHASTGKRVMTSSSSPGISLMSETLSYMAQDCESLLFLLLFTHR